VAQKSEPVKIKKYTNRRLYNTETSSYVTLEDLAQMVKDDKDFVVVDAKSRKDLTHSVLTQIILDQEGKGQNLMPVNFLRQLIRFYGHGMEKLVPSYLELSLNSLTRDQDRYVNQYGGSFTGRSLEAMQEQTRKNLEMFEKAMSSFSPFPGNETGGIKDTDEASCESGPVKGTPKKAKQGTASGKTDELGNLQEQLAAMQEQLDSLTRGK
jgi:polyhydroxyalkanoate synthesis repressor PhaR